MAWSPETDKIHMVSYYGYEIWRHKHQVVKPFLSENACFSTFIQQYEYTQRHTDEREEPKRQTNNQTNRQTNK